MAQYSRQRAGGPRILGRATIIALGLGVVLLLALQSSPEVRRGLQSSRARMDDVSGRFMSLAPASTAMIVMGDRENREALKQLRLEKRSLERWRDSARAMSARMAEYERVLDIMDEPLADEVSARVIAEKDGPFAKTMLANVGAPRGVNEGDSVINANGLVGRIIRTGKTSSRILLLTDYNSRIPVMGRVSLDRALLVGDRKTGARLEFAETPDLIVEGEEWVTSGDDGLLPRGMTVGWAHQDDEGWRLDLAMQLAPVDFVRVIPPPGFSKPEDDPVEPDEEDTTPGEAVVETPSNASGTQ
ncbi:MAG: Rod shape-determining protein MreC [Hirschia sp.]|nr:Rod shape-determining protein MreC [Hirschia sp.]MBF17445.1 Rod shape-determining protein MreC [Hirschia sp.]|tara:strand:+ start:363 stop:1265 length:903 start_codon:yes stop_codon:yes gene_type:complete